MHIYPHHSNDIVNHHLHPHSIMLPLSCVHTFLIFPLSSCALTFLVFSLTPVLTLQYVPVSHVFSLIPCILTSLYFHIHCILTSLRSLSFPVSSHPLYSSTLSQPRVGGCSPCWGHLRCVCVRRRCGVGVDTTGHSPQTHWVGGERLLCTHSFTHSLIHSFTHSLTHSLIHSLIHSFTHSSVRSFHFFLSLLYIYIY